MKDVAVAKQRRYWALTLISVLFLSILCIPEVAAANSGAVQSNKNGNVSIVYGVIMFASFLLAIGYCFLEKKREWKFFLLYLSTFIANTGFFVLSISVTLEQALMANRLSYLGGAFAVLLMLIIIMDSCRVKRSRVLSATLIAITTCAFAIAATGGWLNAYYTSVAIEKVGGVTILVKDYGPLHTLYPMYLIGYFLTMVIVIIYSIRYKNVFAPKYVMLLLVIVLCNVGIWLVEQLIDVDFEFLSVSYIFTELFMLLVSGMLRQYEYVYSADGSIQQEKGQRVTEQRQELEELFEEFVQKAKTLSSAEQRVLSYYIDGYEISQIPDLAYISINTVKKHNRSIYQKLEINSRDELMLYIELFRRCGRLETLKQLQLDN